MELMHKCSPEHLHMGTARLKGNKETEEVKQKRVKMKRNKEGKRKKKFPIDNGLTIACGSTVVHGQLFIILVMFSDILPILPNHRSTFKYSE